MRAAMVADPYAWSSHRCHGAGHADPILDSFPRNDNGSRRSRIHEMRNRVRVMCKPGSEGGRGGQPPRPTRPAAMWAGSKVHEAGRTVAKNMGYKAVSRHDNP